MFQKPTLFVIGAGAGVDLGMPVGEDLSTTIADKLRIRFDSIGNWTHGDKDILIILREIAQKKGEDSSLWVSAGHAVAAGIHWSRSVDSYINAHRSDEKVRDCAKLGIIKTIIEREDTSFLALREGATAFREPQAVNRSWLRELLYILQVGVVVDANVTDVFANLCVINFNYDRCVEHFFYHALQDLYRLTPAQSAELINTHLKIYHPYGVVGALPWQKAGAEPVVEYGGSRHGGPYEKLIGRIKTFNERVEEGEVLNHIRREMLLARQVIFLGFHFHDQNVELLRNAVSKAEHPRVAAFATTANRQPAERHIIDKQIKTLVAPANGKVDLQLMPDMDCGSLFRHFGTTIMAS